MAQKLELFLTDFGLTLVTVMRMNKLATFLLLLLPAYAPAFESLVRVPVSSKEQLLQIVHSGLDVAYIQPEEFVDIVADSNEVALLRLWGFSPFVAVPDLRAQGAGLLGAAMGGYHTYTEVKAFLDSVAAARPDLVSPVFSLGPSLEGREIWGIKVSNLPNANDGRPEVLYHALTHAREPAAMEVLLHTIRHLLQNYGSDPFVTTLLNTRDLYFVPVANPDGYVHNQTTNPSGGGLWRKNRRLNANGSRGVDLNRNYGYQWGLDNLGSSPSPGSETYRGTGPFSEPETQRMRDFILARNFGVEVHYHTYSNLWLFPWGYTTNFAGEYWVYRALADSCVQHNDYLPSPGWQLYFTNGTSVDWSYGRFLPGRRVYSFTPEVGGPGDGFWPPASRIPALCAENLMPNLFLAWAADNPRKILSPDPPDFLPGDSMVSDGSAELGWKQTDAGNPAAGYLLKIMSEPQIVTDSALDSQNWELVGFSWPTNPDIPTESVFYSGTGDARTAVMSSVTDYPVGPNDTLKFEARYEIETGYDFVYVEVSSDGGKTFASISGNLSTSSGVPYNRGHGITGSSGGGWVQGAYPLTVFAGQKIRFRFAHLTDGGFFLTGFYVKNLRPVLTFSRDSIIALPADSFYTAIFDSVGTWYFSVAAVDSQNQTGRYSNWAVRHVTSTAALGDFDGDGLSNSTDVVLLLNYVFLDVAPPHNAAGADLDGDGLITSSDVVLLLNYVFLGITP